MERKNGYISLDRDGFFLKMEHTPLLTKKDSQDFFTSLFKKKEYFEINCYPTFDTECFFPKLIHRSFLVQKDL